MAKIPGLSEAVIRQHAPGELLSRGRSYARSGAVVSMALRGNLFEATVEGSAATPYHVRAQFDAAGITGATCTCPYDGASWCKHIVAALLSALQHPEEIAERQPLAALLAPLDRAQLQAVLERLANSQPEFADAVEVELALLRPAAERKPAPPVTPVRHTPVDPKPLRRQVRSLLSGRNYDGYGYGASIASGMEQVMSRVRDFVSNGDGANALRLLEGVTDEYTRGWYEYDEDGELGTILDELGELWAEALLSPGVSAEDREAYEHRLGEWADGADDYGSGDGLRMAERAAAEGWDDPAIVSALRTGKPLPPPLRITKLRREDVADLEFEDEDEEYDEDEDEEGEADAPSPTRPAYSGGVLATPAERLLAARLRILERQGRTDEYLNLAAATGQGLERALMLVRLGRNDEAIVVGLRDLGQASDALAVATALREGGELDGALRVGAGGLSLAGSRAGLGTWLATFAASLGNAQLALEAAEVAYRSEPTLARYQTLRDLAGDGWEALRANSLAFLRDGSAPWGARSASIDIFLHEGLIDDAIKAVGNNGYGGDMARVMDAATASHPTWVIEAATKQAAAIIERGAAQHYDDAVEWLRRARAGYRAANRSDDWRGYLQGLRTKHGRKYKLMGLIDTLEGR